MTITLRVVLIVACGLTCWYTLRKIRKSQMQIEDSLFWIFLSFGLAVVSLFPGLAEYFAGVLGIYSPTNFVFLAVIFLLLIKVFTLTLKFSQLEEKLKRLVQRIAIEEGKRRKAGKTDGWDEENRGGNMDCVTVPGKTGKNNSGVTMEEVETDTMVKVVGIAEAGNQGKPDNRKVQKCGRGGVNSRENKESVFEVYRYIILLFLPHLYVRCAELFFSMPDRVSVLPPCVRRRAV